MSSMRYLLDLISDNGAPPSNPLLEKIVSKPRNLRAYLLRRIAVIERAIAEAGPAKQVIRGASRDAEYLIRYALRHEGADGTLPTDYDVDLDRHYHLDRLKDDLSVLAQYGPAQFISYPINTLKDVRPLSAEVRTALSAMADLEPGFRAYGYEPGDPATEQDAEYREARDVADAYLVISRNLAAIESVIADLGPVLQDLAKRQAYNYRPDEYRPDHADVETLYHATLYAPEIVRDGFSAEKPKGRRGLGNFGDQSLISFTHDIRIAYDIARGLRDLWMIVHGQLSRRQILGWMAAEGIDPKKAAYYFVQRGEPLDAVEQVIRLYRGYIGLTKLRADPVFISPEDLVPLLRDREFEDIGIVSADVRLDGKEAYMHGEAEFRLPASSVVGPVRRVG